MTMRKTEDSQIICIQFLVSGFQKWMIVKDNSFHYDFVCNIKENMWSNFHIDCTPPSGKNSGNLQI